MGGEVTAVVAIDPGALHTGVVYMDERRVIDARCIAFKEGCGTDNALLDERCEAIWGRLEEYLEGHGHAAVVVEGYVPYRGRATATNGSHQTPWLVGSLLAHLHVADENVALQTSRQVLNPKTRGNAAWTVDWLKSRTPFYRGQEQITNEHLRSAFAHGWYHLHGGGHEEG